MEGWKWKSAWFSYIEFFFLLLDSSLVVARFTCWMGCSECKVHICYFFHICHFLKWVAANWTVKYEIMPFTFYFCVARLSISIMLKCGSIWLKFLLVFAKKVSNQNFMRWILRLLCELVNTTCYMLVISHAFLIFIWKVCIIFSLVLLLNLF
jgi:hypothetical protein